MEELGLGDPLGSLSTDLASYLEGAGFVGSGLEQPFLGELEAIANRLEMPQAFDDVQDAKAEDIPTTSAAALLSQDDDDEDTGRVGQTKRRRRTRTERQQVLNRLAQQRYRQRKKEKVQALQSTVGTLQCQLDRLSLLEAENAELRATTQQLSQQVSGKDGALLQMQQQLRHTCIALKSQQDKVAAQERQIAEQQQTLEAQRQQLRSSTLAGLDPQVLSDRLLAIIKEALAEAQEMGGPTGASQSAQPPLALMSDEVVARISRTLTSCCRELVYATKGKQAASAAAEAPSAIPVSCC